MKLSTVDLPIQVSWLRVGLYLMSCCKISGKFRGTISVDREKLGSTDYLVDLVSNHSIGEKYLQGQTVERVIVPKSQKIINFVLKKQGKK